MGGGEALFVISTDPGQRPGGGGAAVGACRTEVVVSPGSMRVPSPRVAGKASLPLSAVAASVRVEAGGFVLELDEPAYGVAPGQAAVLYDGDAVVGAGLIAR